MNNVKLGRKSYHVSLFPLHKRLIAEIERQGNMDLGHLKNDYFCLRFDHFIIPLPPQLALLQYLMKHKSFVYPKLCCW